MSKGRLQSSVRSDEGLGRLRFPPLQRRERIRARSGAHPLVGTSSLRALVVEDSECDAKLIGIELRRHYANVHCKRVENEPAMRAALETGRWDVILSDWTLPSFSASAALRVLEDMRLDVPFIIVSGTVDEGPANAAMHAGAHDYVLKDNLGRLSAAIDREIGERQLRSQLVRRRDEDDRFFDLSLDMLCVIGCDGYLKRFNPAWQAVLGWTHQQLTAKPCLDFVHPDDRQSTVDASRRLAGAGGRVEGFENRFECKDGSFRTLLWTAVPFAPEQVIFAAGRDVTGRRKLEEQFRQSQKMEAVGSLAGGVAHDFNNLLSVIISYTTVLLEELSPNDCKREPIEEVEKAGLRATELTRQLLAFSRKQTLNPRVLDLNEILAGTEKMLKRLLHEDIDLVLLPAYPLGKVRADPGQLEQVIINLAVNARDAMPRGGRLTLETSDVDLDEAYAEDHPGVVPGPYVMLTVTDSGMGMHAATRARIFEPFFTTKEQGKGTGLGLSTVFGVIQQSRGHILVDSEVGRGTTFTIYLPRTDQVEANARPSSRPPPSSRRCLETILLVEDDQQVRVLARTLLSQQGYNVLEAQNGGEAFLLCEQHGAKIQLLLTDVIMPHMSGRQLAERLLRLRPTLKVLYMSGYTGDAILDHGILESKVAFLQKPLTPESLLREVRSALDA